MPDTATVWIVLAKDKYRDDAFGFTDRDAAYAKAWEIVKGVADEYDMADEIASQVADDDLFGAWDRVSHGEGELTIESVEVASLPPGVATHAALVAAEDFIAGFEDDEMQEGIDGPDGLLSRIRAALAGIPSAAPPAPSDAPADPDIARAKALGLFGLDIFESGTGFVVDGREFPDEEAMWVHWSDASCGPFWVFDVEAQDYPGEKHANLFDALAECKRLNSAKR